MAEPRPSRLPKSVPLFVALFLVASMPVWAHDFYILPDRFAVEPHSQLNVSFNNGDSFPTSENYPIPSRLKDARLLSADAPPLAIEHIHIASDHLLGSVRINEIRGSALLVARTEPHLITLRADKFSAYLNEEGLSEVIAWRETHNEKELPARERYSKYAKALLSARLADAYMTHAVGDPLEIVPERQIDGTQRPRVLSVRVLFRGLGAEGLAIEASWSASGRSGTVKVGRTDAAGRIDIPLTHEGRWRIHALKMERCVDPGVADWESFWASLTFEVST